ncbi:hypothetical protein D9M69_328300 [compost metagenome]
MIDLISWFLPRLNSRSFHALFHVVIDDVPRLNAFLHGFTHASIGFPFAFVLHLQVCPGAVCQWAVSAGKALHNALLEVVGRNFDDGFHRLGGFGKSSFLFGNGGRGDEDGCGDSKSFHGASLRSFIPFD